MDMKQIEISYKEQQDQLREFKSKFSSFRDGLEKQKNTY